MAIGEVLPVAGQVVAECQQLRLLQVTHTLQDLAFGIGVFQGQVEVMQQAAKQAAIEQAKRFTGLGGPQLLGGTGDVIG